MEKICVVDDVEFGEGRVVGAQLFVGKPVSAAGTVFGIVGNSFIDIVI